MQRFTFVVAYAWNMPWFTSTRITNYSYILIRTIRLPHPFNKLILKNSVQAGNTRRGQSVVRQE